MMYFYNYIWTVLACLNISNPPDQSGQDYNIVSTYYYRTQGRTASGNVTTKIKEPFVAISRDLLPNYPMGSYITLEQCRWQGRYKVMDVMNKKYINTIDVYYKGKKRYNKVECICRKSATNK
jgi:3D (Asp-Asp-Asp) domain-containing protein